MRAGLLWLSHWGWGLSIEFGQGVLKLSYFEKINRLPGCASGSAMWGNCVHSDSRLLQQDVRSADVRMDVKLSGA